MRQKENGPSRCRPCTVKELGIIISSDWITVTHEIVLLQKLIYGKCLLPSRLSINHCYCYYNSIYDLGKLENSPVSAADQSFIRILICSLKKKMESLAWVKNGKNRNDENILKGLLVKLGLWRRRAEFSLLQRWQAESAVLQDIWGSNHSKKSTPYLSPERRRRGPKEALKRLLHHGEHVLEGMESPMGETQWI